MGSRRGDWRVVLVRDGASGSRSIRFRDRRFMIALVLGCAVFGGIFAAIGYTWEARRQDARIADLEEQLEANGAQTQQIRQLAARLERADSNYRQLQQIMGGELNSSEREIRLPSLPAASGGGVAAATEDVRKRSLPTSWPVARRGFVSRTFEPEPGGPLGEHHGVDIALPTGSYVRASGGGIVRAAGEDSVYGLFVRLTHDEGVETLYAHNSWLFVAEGDSVEQNEVLALSGNTGQSSAPHLHFEIQRDGDAVDPAVFISGSR